MLYNLYIGSNNDTKKIEVQKIKKITTSLFEGFTILRASGYWRGTEEKSVIVQIESMDARKLEQLAQILKQELHQDAIAIQKLPGLKFV